MTGMLPWSKPPPHEPGATPRNGRSREQELERVDVGLGAVCARLRQAYAADRPNLKLIGDLLAERDRLLEERIPLQRGDV